MREPKYDIKIIFHGFSRMNHVLGEALVLRRAERLEFGFACLTVFGIVKERFLGEQHLFKGSKQKVTANRRHDPVHISYNRLSNHSSSGAQTWHSSSIVEFCGNFDYCSEANFVSDAGDQLTVDLSPLLTPVLQQP